MAFLTSPQPRPRTLSSYSSDPTGPYLSAYPGPALGSAAARRRTSQTFRSSPLAGPVVSYQSLSALDTSSTSHESFPSSSSCSDAGPELRDAGERRALKSTQRCASTGALADTSSDNLRPPIPAWRRNSRRSAISLNSTSSKHLSRTSSATSTQSIPTLSSLISLSITETPHPHGFHSAESHPSQPHEPHAIYPSGASGHDTSQSSSTRSPSPSPAPSSSVPSRRHSRLSFSPSPLMSPPLSASSSSASSLRSTTSMSSMRAISARGSTDSIKEEDPSGEQEGDSEGITIRIRIEDCDSTFENAGNKAEKQRRRLSLPAPAEKHDWLTASPTPVFSRSALRTQSVVMPISALERRRTGSSHKLQVPDNGSRKRTRGEDKTEVDGSQPEKVDDEKVSTEEKKGGSEGKLKTGRSLHRRLTQRAVLAQMPSLPSMRSPKKSAGTKETDTEANKDETGDAEFGVLEKPTSSNSVAPSSNSVSLAPASTVGHSSSLAPSLVSTASDASSSCPDSPTLSKGSTRINTKRSHPFLFSLTAFWRRGVLRKRS